MGGRHPDLDRAGTVRTVLTAVGLFSEHLDRRPDHGEQPDKLDRVDVEAFLARLAHLQAAGRLSPYSRAQAVDTLARFLRDARPAGRCSACSPPPAT